MKKILTALCLSAVMPLTALAQHEEETENGIVSLAGREGFTIASKKGDFVFKPYLLVQTSANFNWYDDEGLDKAYNQDNVANSGFAIPYAVLGFTGKAFGKVSFNLSLNAAATGAALLQQAWFDVELKKQFSIRVGKFKTPFSHAYLTTLGETLMPSLPLSLTAPVILPYSLNAVTPNISIGIPVVKSIRPTTALPLDVHLMIDRPVRYVEQFCDAGADIVTCHVEADTEENILSAINKIHAKGKKAGVVVKPKTPPSAVLPFIDRVELILVMTVEPGFGGQKFMADMMPKVQAIRGYIDAMNPACELEVDGGVDGDTCKLCIASGANVLVAGSAVYKAADIPAKIKELRG